MTEPGSVEGIPETAAAPEDPATRARVDRLIRRTVRRLSVERLFAVMDEMSAEAHRRGLTGEILEDELAAYNAERRSGDDAPAEKPEAASEELVARFRAFTAGHNLGGVGLEELIGEGRR